MPIETLMAASATILCAAIASSLTSLQLGDLAYIYTIALPLPWLALRVSVSVVAVQSAALLTAFYSVRLLFSIAMIATASIGYLQPWITHSTPGISSGCTGCSISSNQIGTSGLMVHQLSYAILPHGTGHS